MHDGTVRFSLAEGEVLSLTTTEVDQVYEELWNLEHKQGALSLAAAIRGATRRSSLTRYPSGLICLPAAESAVLREAMSAVRRSRPPPLV